MCSAHKRSLCDSLSPIFDSELQGKAMLAQACLPPATKNQPEAEQEFLVRCTKPYFIHLVYSVSKVSAHFCIYFASQVKGKYSFQCCTTRQCLPGHSKGRVTWLVGLGLHKRGSVPWYPSKGVGQAWQPGSAKSHDHQASRC